MKLGQAATVLPFRVMDIIAAANERERTHPAQRVVRLMAGQPSTGAPQGALDAAAAALRSGHPLGYTETLGLPPLRRRIAAHYADWYGLDLPPGRIAVTTGASGAFPLAFLACFDIGDRVALTTPYYPPYLNILTALGMVPHLIPTGPETRFLPTVAMLERLDPRPAGLLIASPSNPAGTMLAPDELAAIAQWCHASGVRLISDEIYHGLHYDRSIATAAAYSPSAIVINSFSKYFCMTGWRIGWMVTPPDLIRPVERLAQNLTINPPHIAQIAAEAAFSCHAELAANVARYRANRDLLIPALPNAWSAAPPDGGFYVYCDLGDGADSTELCRTMLETHGIAIAPGTDFDASRGNRTIRLSYCGTAADTVEAVERLRKIVLF